MASALSALLSQQSSNLKTRKALILTGLQNDFLSPDGKLPVSLPSGFIDRLKVLVPAFREHGHVIWVRSEFETNRPVNSDDDFGDTVIVGPSIVKQPEQDNNEHDDDDDERDSPVPFKKARVSLEGTDRPAPTSVGDTDEDEELFLTRTANKEPCCIPGSAGANYASQIEGFIDEKDMQVKKTCYSAFGSTSLLLTLRAKLITELYVCGCSTNLSVYATAMDAARHGIQITLISDCLGYRQKDRHDLAMTRLRDIMGAEVMTSEEVIACLKNPPSFEHEAYDEHDEDEIVAGEDAGGVSLEVDSDVEDDDLVKHWSRHSTLSGRMLALRHGSPAMVDSSSRHPDRHEEKSTEPNSGQELVDSGTVNESSKPVRRKEPWADIIESQDKKPAGPSSSIHPGLAAMAAVVGLDQTTVTEYEGLLEQARSSQNSPTVPSQPLFGKDKEVESDNSRIYFVLLPSELADTIFDELNKEIIWERMRHQTGEVPRMVCCQGTKGEDGSMPVYRHPSDQTMPTQSWTPTVEKIRKAAEEVVGHPLNHALIQLYRGGPDYISEHSDKTLDIVKDSYIVNVSFGAQRTMRLRTKRTATSTSDLSPARTTYRIPMPHNSMIKMSLATNASYLHGINADRRPQVELTDAEKAFGGQRISLTFRHIGTYLSDDSSLIWGQGAIGKTKDEARLVINAHATESEKLVRAFGAENQSSNVDWDAIYGAGSDVLHLK